VVVNVHHLADMLEAFLEKERALFPELTIIVSHEDAVLGTGGGLAKAKEYFSGPFLVVNSDIYTDLSLKDLMEAHLPNQTATLAVVDRMHKATVSVGDEGKVLGFRRPEFLPLEKARLCGCGIMVLESSFLDRLPAAPSDIVERLDANLRDNSISVAVYAPSQIIWYDIGTPQDYYYLNYELAKGGHFLEDGAKILGETSGFLAAEAGAETREGSVVQDSILWSSAFVEEGARLAGMIVAGKVKAGVSLKGGIVSAI
jgi:mannose-1-phosphate guanylyltransferase